MRDEGYSVALRFHYVSCYDRKEGRKEGMDGRKGWMEGKKDGRKEGSEYVS